MRITTESRASSVASSLAALRARIGTTGRRVVARGASIAMVSVSLVACRHAPIAAPPDRDRDVASVEEVASVDEASSFDDGEPVRDWRRIESADAGPFDRPRDADERSIDVAEHARPIRLAPGLRVDRAARTVLVDAFVAADVGFLEQVACSVGTREHESLVSTEVPPSAIHAALLLAGFEPGSPGVWRWEGEIVRRIPPTGSALRVDVLVPRDASSVPPDDEATFVDGMRVVPIEAWIVDAHRGRPFPRARFVFGGSELRENPRFMGPGEHYVADRTGSIVGLVTFGDETVGLESIIADQEGVDAPEWAARTDAMPRSGTPVVLRLRPDDEP